MPNVHKTGVRDRLRLAIVPAETPVIPAQFRSRLSSARVPALSIAKKDRVLLGTKEIDRHSSLPAIMRFLILRLYALIR